MKKLFMFLAILMPLSIIAQNNGDKDNSVDNVELKEWMTKIASDSEMRNQVVVMMIEKTKDNKEEMSELVNSFTSNPELNKMILDAMPKKANSEFTLQPIRTVPDSMKMMRVQPVPRK